SQEYLKMDSKRAMDRVLPRVSTSLGSEGFTRKKSLNILSYEATCLPVNLRAFLEISSRKDDIEGLYFSSPEISNANALKRSSTSRILGSSLSRPKRRRHSGCLFHS